MIELINVHNTCKLHLNYYLSINFLLALVLNVMVEETLVMEVKE